MNTLCISNLLPTLILENVRGFIGNCRMKDGELIMTIDKNKEEFKNLEYLMKRRLSQMKFAFYEGAYPICVTEPKNRLFVQHLNRNMLEHDIGLLSKNTNWAIRSLWRLDRFSSQYRSLAYIYDAESNTLKFQYKRRRHRTIANNDPLKKNMDIELVID